jgi:predicted transposase/invertase (TIGR01784 family)
MPYNTKKPTTRKATPKKDLGVYISLLTDFGFKRIFGEEANKDFLIAFLNAVLNIDGGIADLHYGNPEKKGRIVTNRTAVFDLYCTTGKGERIIVEVQNHHHTNFKERGLFYAARSIQAQEKKGKKWNYELCPVYSVSIVNFNLNKADRSKDKYISYVQLTDVETHKVFYRKLTLVYIELLRFNKKLEELETIIEKWVYLFKNLPKLENLPTAYQINPFKTLFEEAKMANMTPEELDDYNKSLKRQRNMNVVVNDYRNRISEKNKVIAENRRFLMENRKTLAENRKTIAEKDYVIAENRRFLAENQKALQNANARIEELEKMLNKN